MNKRNKPCPCGSGKKYKKCCITKKQRTIRVSVDMERPTKLTHVGIDLNKGRITLYDNEQVVHPEKASSELFYKRSKGEKILSRSYLDPNSISIQTDHPFLEYDFVFSVDTNTLSINDEDVCVTCIMQAKPEFLKSQNLMGLRFLSVNCVEFRNPRFHPEKIGWVEAIKLIQNSKGYTEKFKIALVVDSDLDSHSKINAGKQDIIPNSKLPSNFKLFYGSADTKNDSMANRMIFFTDKEATNLLKYIQSTHTKEQLITVRDGCYEKFRQWTLDE